MKKIIVFTLKNGKSSDYSSVINEIKKMANGWCKIDETVWLINTHFSSADIRDKLNALPIDFDKIFVTNWKHDSAWFGYTDNVSNWLKKY